MNELSAQQIETVLHQVVLKYRLFPQNVHIFSKGSHLLIKIHTQTQTFALKLSPNTSHSLAKLQEILSWTAALENTSRHRFIKAIPNIQGALCTPLSGEHLNWNAVLYPWVSGPSFPAELTPSILNEWGALMGTLHAQPAQARLPQKRYTSSLLNHWDRVFYAHPPALIESELWTQIPPHHATLRHNYALHLETVSQAIKALWSNAPAPIRLHGDLQGPNIICGQLYWTLLDFDDLSWGLPIQDIAIALLPLRAQPQFTYCLEHFKRGYQRTMSWPTAHEKYLTPLMIGRFLALANALLYDRTLGTQEILQYWVRYGQKMQAITNAPSPDGPSL